MWGHTRSGCHLGLEEASEDFVRSRDKEEYAVTLEESIPGVDTLGGGQGACRQLWGSGSPAALALTGLQQNEAS